MSLDVPDLDDRDYEELLDEATKLLPAASQEWTNYNPQDPGITILEMLAWLTDSYVYQIDAVTDAHRQKYLQLMDDRRRPPRPASTRLSVDLPDGVDPMTVPTGTQLAVVDGSGTERTFETDAAVEVTQAELRSVVSRSGTDRTDQTHANETGGMFYRPFGAQPAQGDVLALGLAPDPFAGADSLTLSVAYHDDDLPEPGSHGGEPTTFEPSVELAWEYCTDYEAETWERFETVTDETDCLYAGGSVELGVPDDWAPGEWGADEEGCFGADPGLVWLRCRLERTGYEFPPRLDGVRVGVVPASNRRTIEREPLAPVRGTDDPASLTSQRYRFAHAPVTAATVSVDGEAWTEVPDFDASGPTDTHYVLDNAAGELRFGDGVAGAMPGPDADVVAESYVATDGAAGNVPSGATWRFADGARAADGRDLASVAVTPRRGATGGRDAESFEAAFRRLRRDLKTPYKAVTPADMTTLAERTPGLRVGRATVLMGDRPGGRRDEPPEARVIVVPYAPPAASRPTPSEGFLAAVQAHLDEHRLLTDRVRAVGPTYVDVSVSVEVRASDWRPDPGDEADVGAAVEALLDPIHGFEGSGWPFGRTLYAEELAEAIAGVEWVDAVEALEVRAPGNARVDAEGNVRIAEGALFALGGIDVDVVAGSRRRRDEGGG